MIYKEKQKDVVDLAHETILMDSKLKRAYAEIERLKRIEKQYHELISHYTLDMEQARFNTLIATIKTITN